MRLRMITTIAGPEVSAGAGEVVTVTPTLGAALIETGAAVPLAPAPKPPPPEPERAVAPPAETATAPPQRRRGRAASASGG